MEKVTIDDLKQELVRLAPWHFEMNVKHGLKTIDGNKNNYNNPDHIAVKTRLPEELEPLFKKVYPSGFKGKNFLDVGCNGGGYCFLAKKLGAERVFGFDVRDHWINQANFLKKVYGSDNSVKFEVKHVEELDPNVKYDVTLFKGVFYHLPRPNRALEHLCNITNEIMFFETAAKINGDEDAMYYVDESETHVMSGVDKLAWLPGGPKVLARLFEHYGFPETRLIYWRKRQQRRGRGRIRMVAARNNKLLKNFDELN